MPPPPATVRTLCFGETDRVTFHGDVEFCAQILDCDGNPIGGVGPAGPAGPTGATGAAGASGQQGPPGVGSDGEDGLPGPPGSPGAAGTNGAQGPPGATGAPGATGGTGLMGLPGFDGDDGDLGPPGATGAKGEAGPQGAPGLPGIVDDDDVTPAFIPPGPDGVQITMDNQEPNYFFARTLDFILTNTPVALTAIPMADGRRAEIGASFDEAYALGNNARVAVSKNDGAPIGTRRQINFQEGQGIQLDIIDVIASETVDVKISARIPQGPVGEDGDDGAPGLPGPPGPAGNPVTIVGDEEIEVTTDGATATLALRDLAQKFRKLLFDYVNKFSEIPRGLEDDFRRAIEEAA